MNMLPPRYEEGNPKYNQWVKVGVGLLQKGDVLRGSNLRPYACEAYALNQLS